MTILAPSLLAADFSCLSESIKTIEQAGAQWLHLDIMDHHFVPNLTFGAGVVKSLRPHSNLIFDAHLMVEAPEKYISDFRAAGAEYFTFHYEAAPLCGQTIEEIKRSGMKTGVSVKPKTDIQVLEPFLRDLDLVLVMSVEPGFGGQKFMADMLPKIEWLKEQKLRGKGDFLIEIDGGINRTTAVKAVNAGAEVLVAGTAVFGAESPGEEVRYYLDLS